MNFTRGRRLSRYRGRGRARTRFEIRRIFYREQRAQTNRTKYTNFSRAKIIISNLDYGVSEDDIKELFGEFGNLHRVIFHFDKNGNPVGTCEVIFERHIDALNAVQKYNGVTLDGRPMVIKFISAPRRQFQPQQRFFRGRGRGRGIRRLM